MYVALIAVFFVLVVAIVAPRTHRILRRWRAEREMDRRFKALVARMQTPQAKAGVDALFKATPADLAAARDAYMRHERSMYRIQSGLSPEYEDLN